MKGFLSLVAVSLLAGAIAQPRDPASSYPSGPVRIMGRATGSTADRI